MKRILLPILAILLWFPALADEGMWLPGLIASRIDDMRAKGFHLSAEAIYSINQASMKDAVVLFDGGCTGELVSSEGLLLTNHHCGYDAIQRHSSLEHDYLTDGFWARTREEELPNENLNVRFLVRMEEITDRLAAGETAEAIIAEATADGRYKASVEQMYYGNQQFLFVYEQFDDVRLVGTPPSSIGKFGGDTDNWIWPRHTGDFSVFRIYADRENRPAPYSPDNVPYRPRRHFKISTRGVGEGDFTMIYGFPGNTQQYVLSDAVAYVEERSDPMKIDLRTRRLGIIAEAQEADPATRIRYAAKYANIANAWKKWQGEVLGLRRLGTIEKKRAYERDFARWAADKPEYAHLLDSMRAAYAAAERDYYVAELMYETGRTIDLCRLAALNLERSRAAAAGKSWSETAPEKESAYRAQYADFDPEVDRRLAECVLSGFAEYYPGGTLPADLQAEIDRHGGTIAAYVDYLYDHSPSVSQAAAEAADTTALREDAALRLLGCFAFGTPGHPAPLVRNLSNVPSVERWYRPYMKALMEFDPGRAFFPDANLTLRVAYGAVEGYRYADGVYHKPLTTIEGVIAKDDPAIYDYNVPQRLRELCAAQDYGRWAAEIDGRTTVPVCFLATNHTTGGNSGSPVLNGRGELVGINFDRTWLSTMSDIEFDPDVCRNIAVDIRYVLLVIDRIGGAGHLIDEMEFAD